MVPSAAALQGQFDLCSLSQMRNSGFVLARELYAKLGLVWRGHALLAAAGKSAFAFVIRPSSCAVLKPVHLRTFLGHFATGAVSAAASASPCMD